MLIGGDTLAHKKPDRSVIDHVRKVFDCRSSDMAHIGDSTVDVQAARNAGVAAWAVSVAHLRPDWAAEADLRVASLRDGIEQIWHLH